MRTNWIRVRHADTGGETDIPARSLERYMRRGWFQLADFEVVAPAAEPESAAEEVDDYFTEENQ